MKIITIGGATQDIFVEYPADVAYLPSNGNDCCYIVMQEGQKIDLQNIEYHTGGGATNTAVSFKKLGFEAQAFFKIGTDPQGDYILSSLKKEGINIDNIPRASDCATAISIIIPCPSGDRTVLVYRGANRTITEKELPFSAIDESDHVYITSLSSATAALLIPLAAHAKKVGKLVAANPGSSQLKAGAHYLKEALSNIEILILNSFEASLLMASFMETNPSLHAQTTQPAQKMALAPQLLQKPLTHESTTFILKQFFQEALSLGPKIVVVTHGAEGVYVAQGENILFHPSLPLKATSSVGAGDAFGSAFVGTLLSGKSIEDAIRCGILNATSVITHVGAKTGLLTVQKLEEGLKSLDKTLLQKFLLKA